MGYRSFRTARAVAWSVVLISLAACSAAAPAASTATAPTAAPAAKPTEAPKPAAPASTTVPAAAPATGSPGAASAPSPASAAKPVASTVPVAAGSAPGTSVTPNYKPDAPLNPPVTVKAAFFGVIPDGAYPLGIARGYFEAEGIKIETLRFQTSTDALPAMTTGDIDVYGASPNPALFNAIGRGIALRVLGPIGNTTPGRDSNAVVVRRDLIDSGRFKTLQDLKGMKIAVGTQYSTSHFALKMAMESAGLTLKDADVSAIGVGNLVPALTNKSIEAFASTEPYPTQAEQGGNGKVVGRLLDFAPDRASGGNGILVGSQTFLAKPVAERFMIAWVRAMLDIYGGLESENPQEREAMVQFLAANGIQAVTGVQQATFPKRAEADTKGLETLVAWYKEDGVVTGNVDVNAMTNFDLLKKAYAKLGLQ